MMKKMEGRMHSENIAEILKIVEWLRSLGKGGCSDSTLYLTDDGHYVVGTMFGPGDTKPREIADGSYRPIISLHGLPPRRVARFLKLNRGRLANIAKKLTSQSERDKKMAKLDLLSFAAFAEAWRREAIASPSTPPPGQLLRRRQ